MQKFNEALTQSGALLAADGLTPPADGARVRFTGGSKTVTDGPFAEAKEIVGGYWIIDVELQGGGRRVGVRAARWARATSSRSAAFTRCPSSTRTSRTPRELSEEPREQTKARD